MSEDPNEMNPDPKPSQMSGGIMVGGDMNITHSTVGGRDVKISGLEAEELGQLFKPLLKAIEQAPAEKKAAAREKAKQLEEEVAKKESADDSRIARLVDGIVDLVPGAVSAVAAMFGQPILAGVAGPVTKFVLDKIQGE